MINLNKIDVNELVLKLSNALFNVLDGEEYHDIKNMTGCCDKDVQQIIEARKIAREIAFEKKFVPLDLNAPESFETTPDGWIINRGCEPVDAYDVDVKFFGDNTTYYNNPVKHWDWALSIRDNTGDIQFWRYSKG